MNVVSYTNWNALSDKALTQQIGAFIKQQRLNKNKTQEELAHAAGISRSTLSLLERGETVVLSTFIQVLRVLDLLYLLDAFKIQVIVSPLALAKEAHEKRYRARNRKGKNNNNKSDW